MSRLRLLSCCLLLFACDRPTLPKDAVPAPSASGRGRDAAEIAKSERRLKIVAKCLAHVANSETLELNECVEPQAKLELVGHVPKVAPRDTLSRPAEALSWSVAMDFESAKYTPTLLILNADRVAVVGAFRAKPGPIKIAAAGALQLDAKDRIRDARIWFDQRTLQRQLLGTPPPDAGTADKAAAKPRLVVATSDAAEAAHLKVFARALEASRRGDAPALSAQYSASAVLHDVGPGVDVRGGTDIGKSLAAKQTIRVDSSWAAGDYVVAELRRAENGGLATSSLEILAFEAGRIAEHWLFRNRYRADLAAGRDSPPPARKNAAAVRDATSMTLFEGLPHQAFEPKLLASERKVKRVEDRHGYPFYREPLTLKPEDAAWLTELLVDATSMRPFLGEKKCGGFHPDYAVSWKNGTKQYDALVCFGCGELKWIADGKTTRYDMAHWARLNLETILRRYQKQRPAAPAH